MAGKFVSTVLDGLQDGELHPSAKLVAAALADCANIKHAGIAFPSVAVLARKASISESQARLHLQALEARGWITKESSGKGGHGQATRYRLNLPRMQAMAADKATVHRRVKGPGLPLGNSERTQRPTVEQPNGPPSTTQRPTGGEPELTGYLTGSTRETAATEPTQAQVKTVSKKLNGEPEQPRAHMTREEQIEAARRPADKLK